MKVNQDKEILDLNEEQKDSDTSKGETVEKENIETDVVASSAELEVKKEDTTEKKALKVEIKASDEKDLKEVDVSDNEEPENPEIATDKIDLNALWVVKRLRAKGFEAYLTGGCVRDLLLDKQPKDFDVATNAKPNEVKRIFRNCRLIGRRFLLAHIFFPSGKIVETATFRANPSDVQEDLPTDDLLVTKDNVYGDIEEDAKRRDLTVNGLFYDPVAGKVIDFVGGRTDLEKELIRTIGDPEIRFQEDPVRILRAIKFATRLGFSIEENTLQAMKNHANEIPRCAPARIQEEIVRLLVSGHAKEGLNLYRETGVLDVLMPEISDALKENFDDQVESESKLIKPDDRTDYWFGLLESLDSVSQRKAEISSAVAFTAFLLPGYLSKEASNQNERNWIDKLCVSWSEKIRLTRHDQDRIRLLLSTFRLFEKEKYEDRSALHVINKPWFKEALLVYTLHLLASKESLEKIGKWKALAHALDKSYAQELRGLKIPRVRNGRNFSRKRPQRRRPNRA